MCGCDLCGFACTPHGRQLLCTLINSTWLLSLRSLCMHVHMSDGFSDVCMHMYEQMCGGHRSMSGLFLSLSTLFLETESLTEVGAQLA